MMAYTIAEIRPDDRRSLAQIDALLEREGIRREAGLDLICAAYDEDGNVVATGSCLGDTLRCLAVSGERQGQGLMAQVAGYLIRAQAERGRAHLFVYTKTAAAPLFEDLGFHEIARVEGALVFLEDHRDGFSRFLRALEGSRRPGTAAAVVMNASPFTLGHQYLVETASAACDTLHLFVVSEDAGPIPAAVRRRLVTEGTAHLPNVVLHDTGPYLVSSATFPSYFLKDEDAVARGHARLDVELFRKIAAVLGIGARYVGEEPSSRVTAVYNEVMSERLPQAGIRCVVVPRRLGADGSPISASAVRRALREGDLDTVRGLVPPSTWAWAVSGEAAPAVEALRRAGDRP